MLLNGERDAGAIAQLGERRPCTAEVIGSKPISSTTFAFGVSPVKVRKKIFTGEPPGSMLFENQARKAVTMERESALWSSS